MSLAINEKSVTAVLLSDGWHEVIHDSFQTDSYEFVDDGELTVGGGSVPGIVHTGFTFQTITETWVTIRISGPLSSILAVQS